jgi:hypothetical protein
MHLSKLKEIKYVKYISILIIFYLHPADIRSQLEFSGEPLGITLDNNVSVPFIEIKRPTTKSALDDVQKKYKDSKFADVARVNIQPLNSGIWNKNIKFYNLWRVGIFSPKASSINITFTHFNIKPGVKVFLYSPEGKDIHGAFTFRNNKKSNQLAISPINSDSIIIEVQIPENMEDFGTIQVGQIGLGFISEKTKSTKDVWYNTSASCNTDVSCIVNRLLQIQKHSVCRIIYNNSWRCTGTLINNTSNNGRQLILTAAHSITNDSVAQTSVFSFDYENSNCLNDQDSPIKSVSGSKLLARSEIYDFALVEIEEKIPVDYNPVFAGWDISGNPFSESFTIHHPMGDVKKVAINYDPIINGRDLNIDNDNYWIIPNYEIGTTQAGSSGSAIFDSAFHIRGFLSMGGEACSQNIYDYYIRIDQCTKSEIDSTQQLEYWLDPQNTHTQICPGYSFNPYLQFAKPLTNIKNDEKLISEKFIDNKGFIAGTNEKNINEYAEHFFINGSKYIYAIMINVDKIYTLSNASTITFKIWEGNSYPSKLIYQQPLLLFELSEGYNLIRLDTMKLVNNNFFVGFELTKKQNDDTLAVCYASPQNNIDYNTAYEKIHGIWQPLYDGKELIYTSLDITALTFDYYLNYKSEPGEFPYANFINLYPNPARDNIQILFKDKPRSIVNYSIYDPFGRLIIQNTYNGQESNFSINIGFLKTGTYIVRITCNLGVFYNKFLKIK